MMEAGARLFTELYSNTGSWPSVSAIYKETDAWIIDESDRKFSNEPFCEKEERLYRNRENK